MATAKKTTTDSTKNDAVEVVENTEDVTPAQREVIDEDGKVSPMTFKITVDGEEVELEDRWTRTDKLPPISAMGSSRSAMKYSTTILEQIIGDDQIFDLMERGVDQEEFLTVINAWSEARGLGNE